MAAITLGLAAGTGYIVPLGVQSQKVTVSAKGQCMVQAVGAGSFPLPTAAVIPAPGALSSYANLLFGESQDLVPKGTEPLYVQVLVWAIENGYLTIYAY